MSTARGKGRRVPPSRRRYEATHKTVSARLDPELQRELDRLKSESGMSTADIIRVGLNRARPDVEAAYQRGVEDGFEEGREVFEVPYQCSKCGYWHQAVITQEGKEAAAEFMCQEGWDEIGCLF